jgi:hypothetical protein
MNISNNTLDTMEKAIKGKKKFNYYKAQGKKMVNEIDMIANTKSYI